VTSLNSSFAVVRRWEDSGGEVRVEVIDSGVLEVVLRDAKHALALDSLPAVSQVAMFELMNDVADSLERDSREASHDDVTLAKEVEEMIPRITRQISARYEALQARFAANSSWVLKPLGMTLDLLSPTGKLRHEPTHTQVLGYLLDPEKPHGLGVRVLRELFSLMGAIIPGEDTFGRLSLESTENTDLLHRVRVRAEETIRVDDRDVRCDLWLELVDHDRTVIVVIENKIDASEHGDQLAAYEKAVRLRASKCAQLNFEAKLVYLTPKGHAAASESDKVHWIPISYLQLAAALARASRDADEPGRTFLNLYISSVLRMQGIPSDPEGVQRLLQFQYLNEFQNLGGVP
jgi:hypothetical protein